MVLVLVAAGEYLIRLATGRAARSTRGYDGFVLFGMLVAGASVTFLQAPVWRFAIALGVGSVWFGLTRAELRFRGVPRRGPRPPVDVGDPLPAFAARTSAGEPFTHAELIARAPALLVLYRGGWCPF